MIALAELLLDYGEIKGAIKATDKATDYIFDYTKELQKKIIDKIDDLRLGASTNTNTVVSYTKMEIDSLDKTSARLTAYHDKLDDFLNGDTGAKKTDKKVASRIKAESEVFRRDHGMETNCVEEFFAWLSAEILDESAFCQWLKDAFTSIGSWLDDFKHWFEIDGGKYILGAIGAAVLAVCAAVALVVFAWPALLAAGTVWAWVVAAAGVVSSILLIADSITNCVFDIMAYAVNKTDAAWANRYDSFDTLDTFLEKYRFESATMNGISYGAAIAIKVTNTVCTIINLADMAINATRLVSLYKKNPRSIFGVQELHFRDGNGKITFQTFKYGAQTAYQNYKAIIGQITSGDFMRYQKTLFKFGKLGPYMKFYETIEGTGKTIKGIAEKGFLKYKSDKFKKKFFLHSRYEDIKSIVEGVTESVDIGKQSRGFPSKIRIPQIPTISPSVFCPKPNPGSLLFPKGPVPVIVGPGMPVAPVMPNIGPLGPFGRIGMPVPAQPHIFVGAPTGFSISQVIGAPLPVCGN